MSVRNPSHDVAAHAGPSTSVGSCALCDNIHPPPDARQHFTGHWEAAQALLPAERPAFLRHSEMQAAWDYGAFGQPLPAGVLAMADRIAGDPARLRLAWYTYWRIFEGPRDDLQESWQPLQACLGEEAGLFCLVVALAFIPAVRAYHAVLRLPEAVTQDTCRQVACYLSNYQRGHQGAMGIYESQLGWLAHYLAPNLYFRVGRFEYWQRAYGSDIHVYRHNRTGAVVALAPGQTTFTAGGLCCFEAGRPLPPGCWQSIFSETDAGVTGNPITPAGNALAEPVHLARGDWTCVLRRGDTVLDMHIPAGGSMSLEACERSFRDAAEFFRTHFPGREAVAITSASWMFSHQLEEILPPDANLVRLQRELHLLPVPCAPNDGLWFVFLQTPFHPDTAPRETSLQRALLDYLGQGHTWQITGMFLLLADLPRFGTQPYRRHAGVEQPAAESYWTPETIEACNRRYGVHDYGLNYHYPRGSFLERGYFPPGGYVKDFCILKHEGRWHVFHIDGRPGEVCWITGNEISFGHCSTDNFRHWLRHRMPLAVGDTPLDNQHVWAPFVYPHNGRFVMFYMGCGHGGTAIACAVSPDLERWQKTGPITMAEGRDPFVFQLGDDHILVYTGQHAVNGQQPLKACRSRDLEHWEPLPDLLLSRTGSPESPSIHPLGDGRYVLWFNDWGGSHPQHQQVFRACYAISADPLSFSGDALTAFEFVKGVDELAPVAAWNELHCTYNQPPTSIERVAAGRSGIWLVSYFRVVGTGFRLFLGELDWRTTPATIREISTAGHLQRVLDMTDC